MTNNDVLKKIRYIFDYGDAKMMEIFSQANREVSRSDLSNWLKKEEDSDFQNLNDELLATFLNGLINERRGKREGEQPVAEKKLTNNLIFNKLKIALNFKAEDILETLELASFSMSKHELSALFRKPTHKHYRECKDQALRNFLKGLQLRYRSAWSNQ
ncbi:MAG: DUF1456 family protein [Acidiferrobacterales bacterium]|nr:DUF1456 family protein [Acidiferrobacterales bacterium]